MRNKITRIGLDFEPSRYTYENRNNAIVINRGGYFNNEAKRYRVTPMRLRWVQAVCSTSGFVQDGGSGRAMWYHNIDPMYYNFKYESEFVTLEVLPDLRLKISINDDGREYVKEHKESWNDSDVRRYFTGMDWDEASEEDRNLARFIYADQIDLRLENELLEDALCNGWTLDPDDDGRFFITYDASIDDEGHLDVSAGDLGWSYNFYAIRPYTHTLLDKGYVIFDPYYFGEVTLDDQRALSITGFE